MEPKLQNKTPVIHSSKMKMAEGEMSRSMNISKSKNSSRQNFNVNVSVDKVLPRKAKNRSSLDKIDETDYGDPNRRKLIEIIKEHQIK